MKKYSSYKDSGIEWIGEIPEHWNCFNLKYILRDKVKDGPHETPVWFEDGIPFLSIDGIVDGELSFKGCRYIDEEQFEKFSKKLIIEKDDIFIGKAASIGKIARVKTDRMFTVWSPIAVIKVKKECSPIFVEYYFRSDIIQYQIEIFSTSNTQKNIAMGDIPKMKFIAPPNSEQSQIANYLDQKTKQIDELISKKEQLIKLLEEECTAIINQAVTKGLDPTVPMKDSGIVWLGEIPVHWRQKRLRYIGKSHNGISEGADFFGEGYPFVSYSNVYYNRTLPENVEGLAKSEEKHWSNYSVEKGDVFFTRTSETIEEIGISSVCEHTIEKATFAGFLIRVRPFKGLLFHGFSKYYFRCFIPRVFFVKEMNLVTRASLSQELLKRLPVLLPPMKEQKQIAQFLDEKCGKIERTIDTTKKEIEYLKEYKNTLISEVVTGKIDVREEVLS